MKTKEKGKRKGNLQTVRISIYKKEKKILSFIIL